MFNVDTDCPYICSDCYELGCAFCGIDAQLEAMYSDEDDEDDEN